jgi:hypothetical protein
MVVPHSLGKPCEAAVIKMLPTLSRTKSVLRTAPVAESQSLAVRSPDADATRFLSGENGQPRHHVYGPRVCCAPRLSQLWERATGKTQQKKERSRPRKQL